LACWLDQSALARHECPGCGWVNWNPYEAGILTAAPVAIGGPALGGTVPLWDPPANLHAFLQSFGTTTYLLERPGGSPIPVNALTFHIDANNAADVGFDWNALTLGLSAGPSPGSIVGANGVYITQRLFSEGGGPIPTAYEDWQNGPLTFGFDEVRLTYWDDLHFPLYPEVIFFEPTRFLGAAGPLSYRGKVWMRGWTVVPEPGSFALAAVGCLCLMRFNGRHREFNRDRRHR
jgi:hypothetical protein